MGEEFNITVGPLRQADLADAVWLAANEGWNQTEADWRRIQRLCPQGCFAALSQTTLVGTVTTIRYQRELAWLGMMLVKQGYRGRGIGKRLVSACLNFCKDAGIKTVKLDATPAGKPLYTSCGFSSEATIERWEGVAQVNLTPAVRVVGLDDSMHRQLYDLDREAFRADRRELLDSLIEDGCSEAAVVAESSSPSLGGYGLARRGSRALYVGPIVAVDQLVALSILDAMLVRLQGKKVYLDLLIRTEVDSRALTHRGFVKQRSLTRMFWGKQTSGAPTGYLQSLGLNSVES